MAFPWLLLMSRMLLAACVRSNPAHTHLEAIGGLLNASAVATEAASEQNSTDHGPSGRVAKPQAAFGLEAGGGLLNASAVATEAALEQNLTARGPSPGAAKPQADLGLEAGGGLLNASVVLAEDEPSWDEPSRLADRRPDPPRERQQPQRASLLGRGGPPVAAALAEARGSSQLYGEGETQAIAKPDRPPSEPDDKLLSAAQGEPHLFATIAFGHGKCSKSRVRKSFLLGIIGVVKSQPGWQTKTSRFGTSVAPNLNGLAQQLKRWDPENCRPAYMAVARPGTGLILAQYVDPEWSGMSPELMNYLVQQFGTNATYSAEVNEVSRVYQNRQKPMMWGNSPAGEIYEEDGRQVYLLQ